MIGLLIFSFINFNAEIFPYYGENFFKNKERGIFIDENTFYTFSTNYFDFRTSFSFLFLRKEKNSFFENTFIPEARSLYDETRNLYSNNNYNFLLWIRELSLNASFNNIFISLGRMPISWELLSFFSLFSFFNPPLPFTPSSLNRAGVDGFLFKFEKEFNFFEFGIFPQKDDTIHSAFRIHLSPKGEKELYLLFEEPKRIGVGLVIPVLSGIFKLELLKDKKTGFGLGYDYVIFGNIYLTIEFFYPNQYQKEKILSFSLSKQTLRTTYALYTSYDIENKEFIIFPSITYSKFENLDLNFFFFYFYSEKYLNFLYNRFYMFLIGAKIYF